MHVACILPENKKALPRIAGAPLSNFDEETRALLGRFGLLTSRLPARNASGKVLHILVAELLSRGSSGFVGAAGRAAAVGDDEGVLIFRQSLGEVAFGRAEVDCARNVALLIGRLAVHVDDRDLLFFDRLLEV